jgi:hypothetical protein
MSVKKLSGGLSHLTNHVEASIEVHLPERRRGRLRMANSGAFNESPTYSSKDRFFDWPCGPSSAKRVRNRLNDLTCKFSRSTFSSLARPEDEAILEGNAPLAVTGL